MNRSRTTFEREQQFSKCPKDYSAKLRNPMCLKVGNAPDTIHSRTFKPKPTPPKPDPPRPDPPRPRPKPKPKPGDRGDDGNLVEGILGTVGGAATAGAGVAARSVLKEAARRAGYQALRGTAAAELEGALGSLGGETAYAALATSAAEATAAEIGLEAAGATLVESGLIAAGSEAFLNPVADAVGLGLLAAGAGVMAYEAISNIFG